MPSLQYDAEFAKQARVAIEAQSNVLPVHDIAGRRARMSALVAGSRLALPEDVEQIIHHVEASDGFKVPVYHLRKIGSKPISPTAAILHLHGGGYIGVSAEDSAPSIALYVSRSGLPLFSVDYRLAPENPYPTPLEDCWVVLRWLQGCAQDFAIDPSRIAVMGDSAGGGLAASLAVVARDRKLSPPLAKQILIYPMLDDRLQSDHTNGRAIFGLEDVITGWAAYLGPLYGTEHVPVYAAAARLIDVAGLPPLYLDVGQLDMFLHENWAYVQKFVMAGIPTEFHLYTGVPHAFHRFAPDASVTTRALANRLGAMQSL